MIRWKTCSVNKLHLADIFRTHLSAYRSRYGLSVQQAKVVGALMKCRTADLGGHVQVCHKCGVMRLWYNSCRDRHCPRCQSAAREAWLHQRRAELLPVNHFHLVFTIPSVLHDVFRYNERLAYGLLFSVSWSSLRTLCAEDKYLGALPGMMAVLHTWGQNLHYHPHVHALVPAGGLSFDRCSWQRTKHRNYLVPVRALSRLFRGRLVSELRAAHQRKELRLPPQCCLRQVLAQAMASEWVVYAKPPFGSATKLLDYLGRYLKRVAISEDRLLEMSQGKVSFRYRDYAAAGRAKVMQLDAVEFIRRFLQHVLPAGFCKVRYYGIFANRHRQRTLALCHYLLGQWYIRARPPDWAVIQALPYNSPKWSCENCRQGYYQGLLEYPSQARAPPLSSSCQRSSSR